MFQQLHTLMVMGWISYFDLPDDHLIKICERLVEDDIHNVTMVATPSAIYQACLWILLERENIFAAYQLLTNDNIVYEDILRYDVYQWIVTTCCNVYAEIKDDANQVQLWINIYALLINKGFNPSRVNTIVNIESKHLVMRWTV